MTWATVVREELVPVIIVVALLLAYVGRILTGLDVPDDLRTLVATITAFYFGARTATNTASRVREAAVSMSNGHSTSHT